MVSSHGQSTQGKILLYFYLSALGATPTFPLMHSFLILTCLVCQLIQHIIHILAIFILYSSWLFTAQHTISISSSIASYSRNQSKKIHTQSKPWDNPIVNREIFCDLIICSHSRLNTIIYIFNFLNISYALSSPRPSTKPLSNLS